MISSQTLQAFDPGKVTIKEVSDVVCHRPGTIIGVLPKTILYVYLFNLYTYTRCVNNFSYTFSVVAPKEAGPGKLTVNVRAAGADVDSVVRDVDNSHYEIIFHPTRSAPHKVHVKYNDVHITGT